MILAGIIFCIAYLVGGVAFIIYTAFEILFTLISYVFLSIWNATFGSKIKRKPMRMFTYM